MLVGDNCVLFSMWLNGM